MTYKKEYSAAKRLALSGLFAALAVVLMSLGTLVPVATYCAPMLVSLLGLPILQICGKRYCLLWYLAVAFLSLLLSPDREAALIFALLGYYPLLAPRLRRLPRIPAFLLKILIFNAFVAILLGLLHLLGLPSILSEAKDSSWMLLILILFLLGINLVFFLYDAILPKLSIKLQRLFKI